MVYTNCFYFISVAITACVNSTVSVPRWSLIPFQDVKTAMGITHIDAFKTSGKFTCERSGVYLIAAFVQSNTHENGFTIYKNNKALGDAFGSLTGEYETATAIVIESVTANDTISIQSRRAMEIFNSYESCLSILQVS